VDRPVFALGRLAGHIRADSAEVDVRAGQRAAGGNGNIGAMKRRVRFSPRWSKNR
jgi:hypothetical protein